jgi:aminoglycoside phosphotransferase (APT) family kinase protein
MESKTKTNFSPHLIEMLVKTQFGSAARIAQIRPMTDGWFNSVYAIHFADHTPPVVLRIAPPPDMRLLTYEKDMMQKELLVYQTLQKAGTVPIPCLLGYDFERKLIERDYMFIEHFSGQPFDKLMPDLSEQEKAGIERQVGEMAAAMHAISNGSFGYFGAGPGSGAPGWRLAFLAFLSAVLEDGEWLGVALPRPYDDIRAIIDAHAAALDEVQKPALVHWDLWPVNVFITRQNGKAIIEGVIDWERAYWGDPESESPMAVGFYSPAFYAGYGKPLTEGRNAARRRQLYALYLFLVMEIEAKVRFEEAEHLVWVRAELAKLLTELAEA